MIRSIRHKGLKRLDDDPRGVMGEHEESCVTFLLDSMLPVVSRTWICRVSGFIGDALDVDYLDYH